jgi:hypothetical protein
MRGLNYLGRVMTRRGNYVQAGRYLDESLEIAWQTQDYFGMIANVVSRAELALALKQPEQAVQWSTLVVDDVRTEKHTRFDAQHLLKVAGEQLEAEALVEASEAGGSVRLEPLVKHLLVHAMRENGSRER